MLVVINNIKITIIILFFSTRLRVGDNHGRASVPKGQTKGEI